jgi:hypothetical protein
MKLRRYAALYIAISLFGCNRESQPIGQRSDGIVNGDKLDDAESLASGAVSIQRTVAAGRDPAGKPIGAGTLIQDRVVLTAAHVPDGENIDELVVVQGNSAVERRAKIVEIRSFGGFSRPTQRQLVGVDLALLFLDRNFPGAFPVPLACEPLTIGAVTCTSGSFHQLAVNPATGKQFVQTQRGFINKATFDVDFNFISPTTFQYDANDFLLPFFDDQAPFDRDSGMGCVHPGIGQLVGVQKEIQDPNEGKDLTKFNVFKGEATKVTPFCPWIKSFGKTETKAAFLLDIDGDAREDLIALNQIGGDTFALTLERTRLSNVTFPVTLPGATAIAGATLGTFGGGAPTLALATGGGLRTVSFNEGPAPNIGGSPVTDYTTIATARLNADSIDDLVAQRRGGGIDAFLGGSGGLTFAANIRPIPMKLDVDSLVDFVWLEDDSLHVYSTRGGRSFLPLPDPITLVDGKPGRFRRFSDDAGNTNPDDSVEDLVILGEGILIWCDSTLFGLQCKPALDAPFATGRNATSFEVADVSLDGLDDLIVSYSNAPTRTFLAAPDGFTPLGPARSFREVLPVDLDADGEAEVIAVDEDDGDLLISAIDQELGVELGPFDFGIPFEEPLVLAAGNLNDDGQPSALAPNEFPFQDVVIQSGDNLFALITNGDGTFSFVDIDDPGEIAALSLGDVTGDGIDDIQATLTDGSVTVFAGGAALDTSGQNLTGLPTPDGNDGKMLLLSGLGVDTVASSEARFKIAVAADDAAALDRLTVQIFDGDNGGLHQFEEETNLLKTCYRLSADPCGDGNTGSCSGGPTTPIELLTASSDVLGDDRWDTIYDGAHSAAASIAGDGLPPYNYELRVFLAEDCRVLPAPGSALSVATADAFKVRSNGMLSMPAGELSLVGSDSDGEFGIAGHPYLRDTDYDGKFDLTFAVGASTTEIQLKEADADDLGDSTPGISFGANSAIQYRLLNPSGTAVQLAGAEDTSGTTLVTNPSGNNDGAGALDVETRIHMLGAAASGVWTWQWEGVSAANAFHVFTPFGSPTTHEVLGARRRRPKLTTAEQPHFWQSRTELARALPIVLGRRAADRTLIGSSLELTDAEQALELLDNPEASLAGELRRQLLVAKLNAQRGASFGENLAGGLVYGTTKTVRGTLRAADEVVAGMDVIGDQAKTERLVQLLSSVNLGEITYQQPGVPFPEQPMADADEDGVVDLKDNCPTVANPAQEDEDDNRIGDACNIAPSVHCVLQRSSDRFTAFFGYENPLSLRTLAPGRRNELLSTDVSRSFEQPSEFGEGFVESAFSADFHDSERLSWLLEGGTATADRESTTCSGRELAAFDGIPQAVLFGTESVVVGEHTVVRATREHASIVSDGSVSIGAEAVVDHVISGGRASIGREGLVRGELVSAAGADSQPGARVLGSARTDAVRQRHSIAWHVDFAGAGLTGVVLDPNEARTLAPGEYGDLVVPSGAKLTLTPGRYRFTSLAVNTNGTLAVMPGETVLHVARSFSHQGRTEGTSAEARLVVGYLGELPAALEASFEGTLLAPNAELALGKVRNSKFVGAFAARKIDLGPSSVAEFAVR